MKMKKSLILTAIILLLVPGFIYSDMITFKVGYFIPRAQSDLWDVEFENMDFTKSDFYGTNFSFTYEYFLTKELSFALNIDGYSRKKVGVYRDFVGISFYEEGDFAFPNDFEGDFSISHVFDVSITPIQFSVKLTPMGRRGRFIPYVGGGVGVYFWNVRLTGDIINFDDEWVYEDEDYIVDIYPVEAADLREENKIKVGFHALGGIMFPIANRISIEAEFKFNFVEGELGKDPYQGFQGFERFDLSGYQFTIGLNYWF